MSSTADRERLMQVLLGPHVSEKATSVAEAGNQVVFKVRSDATKVDVRRAVELLFEVKVERVSVVRIPAQGIPNLTAPKTMLNTTITSQRAFTAITRLAPLSTAVRTYVRG